ncbi:MAG: esterase-like activity of phytase family protein [Geminicoccaceae bacterium]
MAGCSTVDAGQPGIRLTPLPDAPRSLGALQVDAAYEIESARPTVGGFSALLRSGERLYLLSDRGRLFRADIVDEKGVLTDLVDWVEATLPSRHGELDSESLAGLPGGRIVVGTESGQGLLTYRWDENGLAELRETWPDPLPDAPPNKSIESLASLPDESLLAISEGQHVGGNRVVAARVTRDAVTPCLYETAEGFEPTGADRVGNLLFVVERQLSFLGGFETRVATVDLPAEWTPGTVLKSREIARFGGADTVAENYEGISASQEAGGGYRLLLVSDDNFTSLQRSLLLDLVWRPDGKVARAP